MKRRDRRSCGLPTHTKWIREGRHATMQKSSAQLAALLDRIRKVHLWQSLDSPPGSRFPYSIALRHARTGDMPRTRSMTMKEPYRVVLRPNLPIPSNLRRRYVYVFVIDSDGRSTLLFPRVGSGSVENRFPRDAASPPAEIDLGEESEFEVGYPRGVDTFYLLSTDEPLRNLQVLEWDGVRALPVDALTELEQLVASLAHPTGARSPLTPPTWSLDRVSFETVSGHTTKGTD